MGLTRYLPCLVRSLRYGPPRDASAAGGQMDDRKVSRPDGGEGPALNSAVNGAGEPHGLSAREAEVMSLIADGQPVRFPRAVDGRVESRPLASVRPDLLQARRGL